MKLIDFIAFDKKNYYFPNSTRFCVIGNKREEEKNSIERFVLVFLYKDFLIRKRILFVF